jgi:hypothetical protein
MRSLLIPAAGACCLADLPGGTDPRQSTGGTPRPEAHAGTAASPQRRWSEFERLLASPRLPSGSVRGQQ